MLVNYFIWLIFWCFNISWPWDSGLNIEFWKLSHQYDLDWLAINLLSRLWHVRVLQDCNAWLVFIRSSLVWISEQPLMLWLICYVNTLMKWFVAIMILYQWSLLMETPSSSNMSLWVLVMGYTNYTVRVFACLKGILTQELALDLTCNSL